MTRRKLTAVVAIVAAAAAAAGIAYATIPDSTGAINTCYRTGSGSLRVVDDASACGPSESALQLGGPTRAYAHSDSSFDPLASDWTTFAQVQLPAGKYLLHGKVNVMNQSPDSVVVVCAITTSDPGTIHLWDQSWDRVDGWDGHAYPSIDVVLQTPLVLTAETPVRLLCVAGDPSPNAIARYRQLDALQVDALTAVRAG